jgi:hypothetical protein
MARAGGYPATPCFAFPAVTKTSCSITSIRAANGPVILLRRTFRASPRRRPRCLVARQAASPSITAVQSTHQNQICRPADVRCCSIPILPQLHFLTRLTRFRAHIPARSFGASARSGRTMTHAPAWSPQIGLAVTDRSSKRRANPQCSRFRPASLKALVLDMSSRPKTRREPDFILFSRLNRLHE